VIWLQTPTVFWLGAETVSFSYWMYTELMALGREKYRGEPLVPEPSVFEF